MLGKIMKYDIKATWPWIVLMDVATVLLGLVMFLTVDVLFSTEDNMVYDTISMVLGSLFGIALVASMLLTFLVPTLHFSRSVFGDEGYLTNTLPVKPASIIAGKGLVFSLWTLLNAIVVCTVFFGVEMISLDAEVGTEQIFSLKESLSLMVNVSPLIPLYGVLGIAVMLFNSVAFVYMCLALGSLFRSHRLLWAVIIGVVLSNVFQLMGTIFMMGFGDHFINAGIIDADAAFANAGILEAARILFDAAHPFILMGLVIFAVATGLFFLVTERIMSKKLNLV